MPAAAMDVRAAEDGPWSCTVLSYDAPSQYLKLGAALGGIVGSIITALLMR